MANAAVADEAEGAAQNGKPTEAPRSAGNGKPAVAGERAER
jgi:hypothetical protein